MARAKAMTPASIRTFSMRGNPSGARPGRTRVTPHAIGKAKGSAQKRHEQAFGEELAGEAPAAGPEGRAHRELALTLEAAGEGQGRHVGAGDEENQAHPGGQDEQGGPNARGHLLDDRPHLHLDRASLAEEEIGHEGPRHASRRGRAFGLGLRAGGPRA